MCFPLSEFTVTIGATLSQEDSALVSICSLLPHFSRVPLFWAVAHATVAYLVALQSAVAQRLGDFVMDEDMVKLRIGGQFCFTMNVGRLRSSLYCSVSRSSDGSVSCW